jgi:small-conductance mechanosensitive channel
MMGKISIPYVPPWLWGPIAFAVWLVALHVLKKMLFSAIRRHAAKTASMVDDILVAALSPALGVLIWTSALYILGRVLPLSAGWDRALWILMILSVVLAALLFVDRLVRGVLDLYEPKADFVKSSRNLVQGAVRVLVLALGIFVILDSLVGHFVRLESGEEGFVTKVGWRSTWIRVLPNNMVIVPNSKLVSGQILNYYLPEPEMSTLVQVGVHYNSDLEHVERVTIEVARDVMAHIENGVPEFDPFIRYNAFGESSINFSVILRTREVVGRYLIQHEFIKRLHKRYREEGIVIPFPIRTLDVRREDLEFLAARRE